MIKLLISIYDNYFAKLGFSKNYRINIKQDFSKPKPQCNIKNTKYDKFKKANLSLENLMIRIGPKNARYKLVWLIGGPAKNFTIKNAKQIINHHSRFFPTIHALRWAIKQNIELIIVRQSQFTKQAQFKNMEGFNSKFGQKEIHETLSTTHKIIKKFKNQGYKVGLMAESFGGFLAYEYINLYGTDFPDKIFISHSKIDIKSLDILNKSKIYDYDSLGKRLMRLKNKLSSKLKTKKALKSYLENEYIWLHSIMESLHKDYTSLLANQDLSKLNVTNGEGDYALGDLSKKEKAFFKAKKVALNIISSKQIDKIIKIYKKETGWNLNYQGKKDKRAIAHHILYTNKEIFINNILYPLGWCKNKDYNDKYSFYKN